ncbi:MAG TPA: hypothetical protein VK395_24100 [Gemmataceae bacterium]|nr:hypothetical protein [Gemmataceae bacterium]
MLETGRFGTRDLLALLMVLAVAAGTRAWYLHTCADNGQLPGPLLVQEPSPVLSDLPADTEMRGHTPPTELDSLVHNLKEHRWFGGLAPLANTEEPTAHLAPGYAALLALLELAPIDLSPIDRTMRWIQCGLGALTAGFYFLFCRRAFRSLLVAALAGLLCAFHPFWIVNTAEIGDGVLAAFLVSVSVFLGGRASHSGAPFSSYLFGLCLAALALVRAALLPFAVVSALCLALCSRSIRRGWLHALLAVLGLASGLAPWSFRNYQRFHQVVPIADTTFLHLWMGNNSLSDGGPQDEKTVIATLAEARGEEPKELSESLAQLSQKERYDRLAEEVVRQVQRDPAGAFRHRLEAGVAFFFGGQWLKDRLLWRTDESRLGDMPDWLAGSYQAIFYGALLGVLILGVLGWRWTYGWRHETLPSSLVLMWIPLPYILSHAESLSGPRLPVDGMLLCYSAFALASMFTPAGRALLRGEASRTEI